MPAIQTPRRSAPAAPPRLRHALALAIAVLALSGLSGKVRAGSDDSLWTPAPYTLGQGLYFPSMGLRIGGYANLQYYDVDKQSPSLRSRDISLFVTKDLSPRLQLFGEVEAGNTLRITGSRANEEAHELEVERLYLDYHADPSVNLRLGKFLTPVGQWNQIHADPLTWTVSRPLSTTSAFARHATGAMVFGTVTVTGHDLDYWAFVDDSQDLSLGQDEDQAVPTYGADITTRNNFQRAIGGRVLWHAADDRFNIGMSVLDYQMRDPRQDYRLVGLDFSWTGRYLSLSGESIHRSGGPAGQPEEAGGFIEAELPVARRLYLVGRLERYRSAVQAQTVTLRTVALNFRPMQGLVFKLERRDSNRQTELAPAGWLASFAVLF